MKMKLFIFCTSLLALTGQINAMMRAGRMPVRRPVVRNYSEIAHIKSKYSLPRTCPANQPVAELTREQLITHLKHQELCWKVAKNRQASVSAKKMIKETVLSAAKTSLKHGLAAIMALNSGNDVGPELFSTIKDETLLSLDMAREAVREYQKTQKDIATAEQALAALVAEQKLQIKMPYDIQ